MCTSPNRIFYWTRGPDKFTKFTFGEKVHHLELRSNGSVVCSYDESIMLSCQRAIYDFYTVGCGRCMECKLKSAKDRTNNMIMESISNGVDNAWFVTLTYDNVNLPLHSYIDDDGVINTVGTLVKKDCQDFIKLLRWHLNGSEKSAFRYVLCGEYGDKGGRPHYHFIGWNLPLNDLKLDYEPSETGAIQYTSEFLEGIWKKGRVRVSECEAGSIAYVARYVQKKAYGEDAYVYTDKGIVPPFILQSKGIGKQFYLDNKDKLLAEGRMFVSFGDESVELQPTRYFEKLMIQEGVIDESTFDDKKAQWADIRDNKISIQLSQTSDSYEAFQKKRNSQLLARTKSLVRKGEFE